MTLLPHAAHGLGPLADRDPERAVRAGARASAMLLLFFDRVLRHAVLRRRRGGPAPAAIRSSSSTCSGSSATPRSTSSSCRPGASSATCSRSSRASRRSATGSRCCAMIAVTVLSAVVYGHHMFVTGVSPLLGAELHAAHDDHLASPADDALPQLAAHALAGAIRLTTPMLFCARRGLRLRRRRAHRPLPGRHHRRHLPARHLLRGRALPPDHGGGAVPGARSRRSTSGSPRCSAG